MADAMKEKAAAKEAQPAENGGLVQAVATRFNLEASRLIQGLREHLPRHRDDSPATNGEIMAYLSVCLEHNLNPFVGEIYGFVAKSGRIQPIIGVDGWLRKMNEHEAFDGMEFHELDDEKGNPISVSMTIYRKDRSRPLVMPPEYFKECYRPTEPWNMMPHRMLRHKAVRQAARYGFGFATANRDEDYYDDVPQEIHVGSGVSDSIANATASKTEDLKTKIDATKKKSEPPPTQSAEAPKSADASPPVHPGAGATQTGEPVKSQTEPAPTPKPEPPPPPPPPDPALEKTIGENSPEQIKLINTILIGKDRAADTTKIEKVGGMLQKAAQDAIRKKLIADYAMVEKDPKKPEREAKTKNIKFKDYPVILEWADDWNRAYRSEQEPAEEF